MMCDVVCPTQNIHRYHRSSEAQLTAEDRPHGASELPPAVPGAPGRTGAQSNDGLVRGQVRRSGVRVGKLEDHGAVVWDGLSMFWAFGILLAVDQNLDTLVELYLHCMVRLQVLSHPLF